MRFHCATVDPDLLFLGCLATDPSEVAILLGPAELDLSELRAATESQLQTRKPQKTAKNNDFTLTSHGKSAIDKALVASRALGSNSISIVHLVLGVAEEPSSCLFTVLKGRGMAVSDLMAALTAGIPSTASPLTGENGLSARLAKMQPLDALAVMTIREIKLTVSLAEANHLEALLGEIDRVFELVPSRSGAHPIAETMSDAVHLAAERREPLVSAHLLAAMYRRLGSIVNIAAPRHYASPEEMLDRLVPKGA